MKKGWKTASLEALVIQQKGAIKIGPFGSQLKKCDLASSGIHVVGIENVLNETFDGLGERFISSEKFENLRTVEIFPGDLLITMMGTIGKVAVVPQGIKTSIMDSHLLRVRPNPALCLTEYLAWAIRGSPAVQQAMESKAHGSIMQGLNSEIVRSLPILLPPLPEQQRIVSLLDEAFEGIATATANAEKNLQNARALFESHLNAVFTQRGPGWVGHKLKSITTKIGSGATPRGGEEAYKKEGISLIRSLNVHDLGFKYTKLAFLDNAQADELSNVEVQPRDVLLNITGASVARCTIVPEDVLPARVNQHVSIIRPIADKLDADFLHYLLISKPYKDQLLKTGEEGGSTRQAITKAQIQEFSVEYPATLKEQKTIVIKLDAMLAETQRLESIYQQKLTMFDELKKALLHKAFSGEL